MLVGSEGSSTLRLKADALRTNLLRERWPHFSVNVAIGMYSSTLLNF
jgi:hypothetical protein